MPKPIVCLSSELRQYMESFRACFSRRQWKYFVIVLLGLVECDERKTLSGLRRVVAAESSLCGLSRFLSKWKWEPEQVAQVWQQRFRVRRSGLVQAEHERLSAERPHCVGRPKATVVTGSLIMDDSVHVKPKGRKMGGLGQHYSNTESSGAPACRGDPCGRPWDRPCHRSWSHPGHPPVGATLAVARVVARAVGHGLILGTHL